MPKLRERLAGQFNSASSTAFSTRVLADIADRLAIDAGGRLTWGGGAGAGDVTLYRSAVDTLKTDDAFVAASLRTGVSTVTGVSASTTGTAANQLLDSSAGAAIKYIVRADDGTDAEVAEILALVKGSTVNFTEYGRVTTGIDLASYTVTYEAGAVQLRCTPFLDSTITYAISRQTISTT